MELFDQQPEKPSRGLYSFKAVFAAGPFEIQKKDNSRGSTDTFTTLEEGVITASGDGVIYIGDDESIQVLLGAGDKFYLNKAESGRD